MPVRAPSTPSRSSVFLCAREGIVTLPLAGRLGTGMSRTLILLGLILATIGLLWRWSGPLRLGRLPGDIVVERVHS